MSRQPSPLTDWTPDSDGSVNSDTMKQSTDRHIAPLAKPRPGEDCDVCCLATLECNPEDCKYLDNLFSVIKSSALAGRRCCGLIVDAIETWLRHSNHRAHNAVLLGSGLLFDTLTVILSQGYWKEEYRNDRRVLDLQVRLYWPEAINEDVKTVILSVFAPYGMQKQTKTHLDLLTNRD